MLNEEFDETQIWDYVTVSYRQRGSKTTYIVEDIFTTITTLLLYFTDNLNITK